MATITIWGAHTPRSLRPLWMAEELGVVYEHRPIAPRSGETKTPEFSRLNPRQKIPLLVDGEATLAESVAICRYLRDHHPGADVFDPPLPSTPPRRTMVLLHPGEIDETSLYVMRRHGDLAEIYGGSETVVASRREYGTTINCGRRITRGWRVPHGRRLRPYRRIVGELP